ncbi:hypothetical protein Ahy_B09g098317 [Arachis hypogaea]|uniref:SWIM-type domain-containing protein n=1 Tax=Arachis hypogaea TaxID=3818 RepID=A0A444XQY2_ARAHY|nr:hypothetical protein Ahy_B09g098317 [Arachis hypogaea]
MLTGILCVHACAAIDRVNKHSEDFCHKLLTIESYKATYSHHINPLPSQQLWERSENNRPLAPLKGHTKRESQKKRVADAIKAVAAAIKAAEAVAKDPKNAAQNVTATASANATTTSTSATHTASTTATATVTTIGIGTVTASAAAATADPIPLVEVDIQQAKIDLSQPSYSEAEDSQKNHLLKKKTPTRPAKLPPRRRSPPPTGSAPLNPMQGGSDATAARLAGFLKFVSAPRFKAPRKK